MPHAVADLPGWTFEVQEFSSRSYEVIGFDHVGHRIQKQGSDVEALIVEVREAAKKLSQAAR
jgi:hypothetical protein